MALIDRENTVLPFNGMANLPVVRQLALLVGLAASIALGVAVVMWSQQPDFVPLYGTLPAADSAKVVQSLEQRGVPYKLEGGAVAVPAEQVHQLRLQLAGQGLPGSGYQGFELLDREQSFGTSSFMENARYQRALEGELTKSIASLDSVSGARVHLAIPKQSAFVRRRSQPSASVLVNVMPGRALQEQHVAGIVNLVASSVPGMEAEKVTVVDQRGRLLTRTPRSEGVATGSEHLQFLRQVEKDYSDRIVELLTPVLGADRISAKVSADIDFTVVEKTMESYSPEKALRSEQTTEELTSSVRAEGVPGALSNSPPPAAEIGDPAEEEGAEAPAPEPRQTTRHATRNYELDRTISHVREAPGSIRRLSVAVLVDYRDHINDAGNAERVPLGADEIARIEALVKEAVGFNAERGDSVNVANVSFLTPDLAAPVIDEPAIWQQPWVARAGKQALGVLAVGLLIFGVLRPVLKNLSEAGSRTATVVARERHENGGQLADDQVSLSAGNTKAIAAPESYEQQLTLAKSMVSEDPKRVAQVVKGWVSADG